MSNESPSQNNTQPFNLRPWPELQALLPPLPQAEFDELKASIAQDGVRVPILALPDGTIIDGLHRWRACQELGIDPPVQVVDADEATAFRLALSLNLHRRQLSFEQLHEIRRWQKETYFKLRAEGLSQAEAAARVGVAQRTGSYWEGHNRGASNASTFDLRIKVGREARRRIAELVASGESPERVAADFGITPRHVRRIVAETGSRKALHPVPASPILGDSWAVHTGDMSVLDDIVPDNSVHLFLTDPPWSGESVGLYGRVAELASKKLVPGGLCVAFTGKYHLHEALARMLEYLAYYWVFSFELSDKHPVAWDKRIWSSWRPLIAVQKPGGERRGGWLLDFLPRGRMDKRYHEWQQSLTPVRYLIEKLTEPGDLVIDPCCGTGTVGVACRLLGRRFVGAEKDPETAAIAKERIARAEEEARLAEVGS